MATVVYLGVDWTRRHPPLLAAVRLRVEARDESCGTAFLGACCWASFRAARGARRTAEGASIKRCVGSRQLRPRCRASGVITIAWQPGGLGGKKAGEDFGFAPRPRREGKSSHVQILPLPRGQRGERRMQLSQSTLLSVAASGGAQQRRQARRKIHSDIASRAPGPRPAEFGLSRRPWSTNDCVTYAALSDGSPTHLARTRLSAAAIDNVAADNREWAVANGLSPEGLVRDDGNLMCRQRGDSRHRSRSRGFVLH